MSERCSAVLDEVRRVLLSVVAGLASSGHDRSARSLLDVGCWDGEWTMRFAERLQAKAYGVEIFAEQAAQASQRGVEVARVDLETQRFPWDSGAMDLVIANQVLEHLKNVWLPLSEIFRVTKVGGHALLSVPNLGSFHNRVMLALGLQPTSIRVFGPHVRGFTFREFRRLVTYGDAFRLVRSHGIGFHPLPVVPARAVNRVWPGGSHTTLMVLRKERDGEPPWQGYLRRELDQGMQTFFE